jgi:formylglycine-generating enzyme
MLAIGSCGRIGFDPLQSDATSNTSVPTSCSALTTTCVGGSCCESDTVLGGPFERGYDVAGDGMYTSTIHPATVSSFRLDKYETTVGRFRAFVAAGMGTQLDPPAADLGAHAQIPGSGWDASWNANLPADSNALAALLQCDPLATWTPTVGANEDRPINCVSWFDAMAFCAWDGGYLPTEAEWAYAASGGADQRAYPWSNPAGSIAIDDAHASYFIDATEQCFGDGVDGCAITDLIDVGTKPLGDGKWGQSDLGGNVWEWSLDWSAAYVDPCIDCANLVTATMRVIRGAGFDNIDVNLRSQYRFPWDPTVRSRHVGLRCARAM